MTRNKLDRPRFPVLRGLAAGAGLAAAAVTAAANPPPNDECANAITIGCNGTVIADNTGATVSPTDFWTCRIGGGVGAGSIWYRFEATHTSARVQTCGTGGGPPADDSIVQVFSGTCGNLVSIGCNDDGCNGFLSQVDVQGLTVGQMYYIQLSSWTAASLGAYTLEVICPRPTAIPNCSNPVATITTADLPFTLDGTFEGATGDPNPPQLPLCSGAFMRPSRWIRFVSTSSGLLDLTTDLREEPRPLIDVYHGHMCTGLTCVAFGDGGRAIVEVGGSPEQPQTYHIALRQAFGGQNWSFAMRYVDPAEWLCELFVPDAVPEGEPGCAPLFDTFNGGCFGEGFTNIALGATVAGTAVWEPTTNISDQDWYTLTLPDTTTIRVSARANVPMQVGLMETWVPNPTGDCSELTYSMNPVILTQPDNGCPSTSFDVTLNAGTWMIVVQPDRTHGWTTSCGSPQAQYTLRVGLATTDPACINPLASLNTNQLPTVLSFNMSEHPTVDYTAPVCLSSLVFNHHFFVRLENPPAPTPSWVSARVPTLGLSPAITVYRGESCDDLVCVAHGRHGEVRFDAEGPPGTTHQLVVSSEGGEFLGELALQIEELCNIFFPPLAQLENEPNCGLPVDTTNGGCSLSPPAFGTIQPGVPVAGTIAHSLSGVSDRDYFQFTLEHPKIIDVSAQAEFPAHFGLVQTTTPSPTGDCSEMGDSLSHSATIPPSAGGVCAPAGFSATLGAGTWTLVMQPDPTQIWTIPCGSPQGRYILSVNFGGSTDCNQNGIPDHLELAANPALDCFNPGSSTAPPFIAGGADGILDMCQCVANWNRDAAVNSMDISAYITSWLTAVTQGTSDADVNCDDLTNSTDISAFITIWIDRINTPTSWFGCPE